MTVYTLNEFNEIIFNGFNYEISPDIMAKISELSKMVGSPTYIKTPIFQKKDIVPKIPKKEWTTLVKQQPVEKSEDVKQIDSIRILINKITDKNYIDILNKIFDILEKINEEDMKALGLIIFEIASTNRFYSKIYADLYSEIIFRYPNMENIDECFDNFSQLFSVFEYVDPNVDYNEFCRINKNNEKRKALCLFFVNMAINGIIPNEKIIKLTKNILKTIYSFISEENKTNEVNELTEIFALLFNKSYLTDTEQIADNLTINEIVRKLIDSKVSNYKSFTSKSKFKFMDLPLV
jgi:hypothetical protein